MQNHIKKLGILAAVIVAIVSIFQFTSLDISNFTRTNVKNFILGFGIYAPILYLILYTLRSVILVLPVGIMSAAGGLAFGIWWGWLLNVFGATLGSCVAFWVARFFGRGFIESIPFFKSGKLKTLDDKAEVHGFKVVLFMRLIPHFQFDAVNFGSGLSKVKFRDYIIATPIGMIPGGFVLPYLGSSLENLKSPKFFIAVAAFILLMLVPFIYIKMKKRGDSMSSEPNKGQER